MSKQILIGCDDFEKIITQKGFYIDKTLFIKELLDTRAEVTLVPRPRRFGKTLNMTMLKYFFEKNGNKSLFDGLEISKHDYCMKHQGQYPVIYLTFKNIKSDTWEDCYDKLKKCIAAEFERYNCVLQRDILTKQQQEDFGQIINRSASQASFENSLMDLSLYLQKY